MELILQALVIVILFLVFCIYRFRVRYLEYYLLYSRELEKLSFQLTEHAAAVKESSPPVELPTTARKQFTGNNLLQTSKSLSQLLMNSSRTPCSPDSLETPLREYLFLVSGYFQSNPQVGEEVLKEKLQNFAEALQTINSGWRKACLLPLLENWLRETLLLAKREDTLPYPGVFEAGSAVALALAEGEALGEFWPFL